MNCQRAQSILNGTDDEAFSPTQFSAHLNRCARCKDAGAELLALAPAKAQRTLRPSVLARVAALLLVAFFFGRQFALDRLINADPAPLPVAQSELHEAFSSPEKALAAPQREGTAELKPAPLRGQVVLTSPVRRERHIAVMTPQGPGMITVREQIERSRILPGIKTVEDVR